MWWFVDILYLLTRPGGVTTWAQTHLHDQVLALVTLSPVASPTLIS
jgi:hypothetical protein